MAVETKTNYYLQPGSSGGLSTAGNKGIAAKHVYTTVPLGVTAPEDTSARQAELDQQLADYGAQLDDLAVDGSQIKADWDAVVAELGENQDVAMAKLSESYDFIKAEYMSGKLDSNEILGEMRTAMSSEIGKMANSYNNVMAREAERVDALVANGALGGNAYRAYQAHTQTNRDLMAQATGQIAAVTLQYTDSIATKAIQIGQVNAANYSAAAGALSSIAGKQADTMLGFSDLLVKANAASETSLLNIYGLQLGVMAEQNKLFLANRELDNQLAVAELTSLTQIETTRINKDYPSYYRGGFAPTA